MPQHPKQRLHKALAKAGITSLRKAETLIEAGRISVNGKTATIGQQIDHNATVRIDGHKVHLTTFAKEILILHKPEGVICSHSDPHHTQTIYDLLPPPSGGKWMSIGRLDIATSGLLLVTNDGQIAHYLMHPSHQHKRVYQVRVRGEVTEETLKHLQQGIQLEDGKASFHSVEAHVDQSKGSNQWYQVSLYEGRNRIVRRLWEAVGCQVSRLIRTQMGDFRLPKGLEQGAYQSITEKQKNALYRLLKES